jgi:hypothetical protein
VGHEADEIVLRKFSDLIDVVQQTHNTAWYMLFLLVVVFTNSIDATPIRKARV